MGIIHTRRGTVSDALTHLEPLERPIAANPTAVHDDRRTLDTIQRVVREQTEHRACRRDPALALEAWWRYLRPPSDDAAA